MRNNLDLEAIRARAAAATPGPWYWAPEHPEFSDVFSESDFVLPGETPLMQFEPDRNGPADAEFVAYARQDVPALIDEVERLRTALAAVESLIRDTDGGDVDPDAEIPVGEIRRVLHEDDPRFRPGWLQDQVARSVASLERLPSGLRASLRTSVTRPKPTCLGPNMDCGRPLPCPNHPAPNPGGVA